MYQYRYNVCCYSISVCFAAETSLVAPIAGTLGGVAGATLAGVVAYAVVKKMAAKAASTPVEKMLNNNTKPTGNL